MKQVVLCFMIGLPSIAYANNIPSGFDNRPVLPTLEKMAKIEWQWKNFAQLPNTSKLVKDDIHSSYYSLTQNINEENPNTTITFYGTKAKPEVAVIESRTWGAGNTQETYFVKLQKLKGNQPLKSNCNFKQVDISEEGETDGNSYETGASLDFQQVYLLSKQIGQRDLYAVSSQVETYVVTSVFQTQAYTKTIITPYKHKLAHYIHQFGWNTNAKGKTVKCVVH